MSLENIYLTVLIVVGIGTVLYFFFGDAVDGIGEGIPFFDPALVMAFITFTAAGSYIFERYTGLQSVIGLLIAIFLAISLSTLLYFFVLLPIRSAEVSLAYTDESLEGVLGKVIVPIPQDGFGEVLVQVGGGVISKRATSIDNKPIDYEQQVLVIEVKDSTLFVKEYDATWKTI